MYSYNPGDTSANGKLSQVLLTIKGVDYRRVSYTYYGSGEAYGSLWDLKLAVVEESDSGWQEVGQVTPLLQRLRIVEFGRRNGGWVQARVEICGGGRGLLPDAERRVESADGDG